MLLGWIHILVVFQEIILWTFTLGLGPLGPLLQRSEPQLHPSIAPRTTATINLIYSPIVSSLGALSMVVKVWFLCSSVSSPSICFHIQFNLHARDLRQLISIWPLRGFKEIIERRRLRHFHVPSLLASWALWPLGLYAFHLKRKQGSKILILRRQTSTARLPLKTARTNKICILRDVRISILTIQSFNYMTLDWLEWFDPR